MSDKIARIDASRPPKINPNAELISLQPPHSLDAERAVLGSLILLPEVFDEVSLIVRSNDFYDDAHRRLYEVMLAMHDDGQRIDPLLLVDRLQKAEILDAIGGRAYLVELGKATPTAAHAEHYARIVADKAMLLSLIHASIDIEKAAYDPSAETRVVMSLAEQRVFSVLEHRSAAGQVMPIAEVIQESLDRIDARMDHHATASGVETGFADFDTLTGGLQKSELVILAARPSMGKTALAMNMAEYAAVHNEVPVLFVSLEMSRVELGDRLLCSIGEVDGNRMRNGTITADERRKIVNAAATVSQKPLHIDDSPSRTISEIAANARRLKRRNGLGLVVIDYLQLIEPDNPRDPRQEQVAKISRRLKGLARELEVPVLCLAQLNRQVESSRDNKPQLSNLRESGAIEQDADVVMFVHRDEYYANNEEERDAVRGEADLLIRKQRNGPTGDVKLTWDHKFTRFRNFSHKAYVEFQSYGDTKF